MRAKGNCSWVLLLFLFLQDQKEDVTWLGRECLVPTLETTYWFVFGEVVFFFFFPRGGLCSEGKTLVDVGYFLSPPVDFSFTMGEDFLRNTGWNIAALCSVSASWFSASVFTSLWLPCFLLPLRCEPVHPADCQPPEHVFLLQTQLSRGPKKRSFSLG